jgi:SNF2 family DNA or RNA helicase
VKLDRVNTYPGTCCVCTSAVSVQRGYSFKADQAPEQYRKTPWLTLCRSLECAAKLTGQTLAVVPANVRELRADGTIVMPYDEAALPLLRAIASWDQTAQRWQASLLLRDRDLVLSIANQLGLVVAESLRTYEDPEYVQRAVARARAVPTIRKYQVEGIRWLAYRGTATGGEADSVDMLKRTGALLADAPGCGKTNQTLLSLHDDEGLLVVSPVNAKLVWPREAEKWCPGRFTSVHICDTAEDFRWPAHPRELVVINFDILPHTPAQIKKERVSLTEKLAVVTARIAELQAVVDDDNAGELNDAERVCKKLTQQLARNKTRAPIGKPPCKVLAVADEAHYVENNKAQRTVRWRFIATKATRVYALTGTPVESEPLKLNGLLTSARCNPFTWTSFQTHFNAIKGKWGGIDFLREKPLSDSTAKGPVIVAPGTHELLLRFMLRRTKEQVLTELPPKIYSEIPVELPKKLIAELDDINEKARPYLERGELPPFEMMSVVRAALATASIAAMTEVIESYEQAGLPLLVFSAHVAPIAVLSKRKGWFTIDGDTSATRRDEIEIAFQSGEGFGVGCTLAGAASRTLTRASTVLFVDRFWERKHNEQAEDRAHRMGQRDSVNVITLVPEHPLTRHVADLLHSKSEFVGAVLSQRYEYFLGDRA